MTSLAEGGDLLCAEAATELDIPLVAVLPDELEIYEKDFSAEAKERLIERFSLSEAQAQAIVDMRLRALTGLEREKLQAEHDELVKKIAELKGITAEEVAYRHHDIYLCSTILNGKCRLSNLYLNECL